MSVPQVNPDSFREEQRLAWNAISSGWESVLDTFERGGAPVTRLLLQLGGVRPGQAVLDVGTGLGEPALTAARVVGPAGRVVGIDFSSSMLDLARRRADGLGNVEFMVSNLESVSLPERSFDVVLSRWGLMFAFDHVATFSGLARLLVPGGVLAAAVWGPAPDVPMIGLGFAVLSQRLELPPPPPGMPGPFSMSDPARLTSELTAAGFTDVSVTEFVAPFWMDTVQQYIDLNRAVSPPRLYAMLRDRFGSADDPATWQAVGKAAEKYRTPDGLSLPSTALCLRAVAP
jgi:SAM-dependent methyltransferase